MKAVSVKRMLNQRRCSGSAGKLQPEPKAAFRQYVPERIRKTGYVFLGPDTFPLAEDQPDIIIIIIISISLVLLVLISLLLFILLLLLLWFRLVLSQGKRIGPKEHVSGDLDTCSLGPGYVFLGPDTFPLAE